MADVSELAERFGKSKLAEALRVQVVDRLLVDVETGRVRGFLVGATAGKNGNPRLRLRVDGYTVVWDPETDVVVWAGGRGFA